jgi:small-conductance mechanosensitive channel
MTATPALAVLCAVGVLALLVAAIGLLRRRSFLVRQLTFPLAVAALAAGLEVYARLRPGAPWLGPARAWLLLFLGLVTILRLLALLLFDVHLRGQRGVRLPPLLPAVAMALVYLLTAFVTLKLSFPAFDVGPLLATSAVTSLVLGLALQPILANFFAGLVISVERPFRINDWIQVGDQEGRVVAITWRTTHLRTRDNDNIVIPNGKLAEERVHNFYYPHPLHLVRVRVGVHYTIRPTGCGACSPTAPTASPASSTSPRPTSTSRPSRTAPSPTSCAPGSTTPPTRRASPATCAPACGRSCAAPA